MASTNNGSTKNNEEALFKKPLPPLSNNREDTRERKIVNILILGDSGIGKTTFIESLFSLPNIPQEEAGIFKKFNVRMFDKQQNWKEVRLFDLYPGFDSLQRREGYPTNVHAIILCFCVAHYKTLRSIYDNWFPEVNNHFRKDMPLFLVGLRSDARRGGVNNRGRAAKKLGPIQLVEKWEVETFHRTYPFQGYYFECSMTDFGTIRKAIYQAFYGALKD